ncbi:MAG: DUF2281 domain-containing protein [Candidatus Sericytochromatia bacterium]
MEEGSAGTGHERVSSSWRYSSIFQDQQFLNELHELPAEQQSKVLDLLRKRATPSIRALKRKQETSDKPPRPRFGSARGLISMSDDFDEPLKDFAEYI